MGVMGKNIAFNFANNKMLVSIFNRSRGKVDDILSSQHPDTISPYFSISDFFNSLKRPRCVMLMIKSGKSVDDFIQLSLQYLEKDDVLIDGGNSFYQDSITRSKYLKKYGIHFLGVGVSGGEHGALNGPSIMPGGSKYAYKKLFPIFRKISAKYKSEPCVSYIGPDGSGHYVKMVHNGIEYSDMQLIAETYFLLKNILKLDNLELSNIFAEWNLGELSSYLIEITSLIFKKRDNFGNFVIDLISDEASHKGTGMWSSQSALSLESPLSLITESVFSRYISSLKVQRMLASSILSGPQKNTFKKINQVKFIEDIRRALYFSKIVSYAQGFSQLNAASCKYNWNLQYDVIAKIFRAGCIIRAEFLNDISNAYSIDKNLINLLLSPLFQNTVNEYHESLRRILSYAIKYGISVPVFSAALSYYDSYRSQKLPANLIQAQRDFFGAHTYQRIDQVGNFHTKWDL